MGVTRCCYCEKEGESSRLLACVACGQACHATLTPPFCGVYHDEFKYILLDGVHGPITGWGATPFLCFGCIDAEL